MDKKYIENHNFYKINYQIVEDERWNRFVDEESVRIFFHNPETHTDSTPNENGLCMEDIGQEEWAKIQRVIHNYFYPDGGIEYAADMVGEQEAIIVTNK